MSKITELVWSLAEPVAKANGCELWDVEYVKEAGRWFLRIYIDRDEGVTIQHCEDVSRALDPILDEHDPIPGSYTFEVSSAGAERALKRPRDFEKYLGHLVEIKLYKARDGGKQFIGKLAEYEDGGIALDVTDTIMHFEKSEVAHVRLRIG